MQRKDDSNKSIVLMRTKLPDLVRHKDDNTVSVVLMSGALDPTPTANALLSAHWKIKESRDNNESIVLFSIDDNDTSVDNYTVVSGYPFSKDWSGPFNKVALLWSPLKGDLKARLMALVDDNQEQPCGRIVKYRSALLEKLEKNAAKRAA